MNLLANLAMLFDGDMRDVGLWAFLSIGAVSLFVVFIPIVTWIESRRKEREAFYKAETVRRLVESQGNGAQAAIDLLKEEGRQEQIRKREGMKIGGAITLSVGVALCIFFNFQGGGHDWVIGLIPGLIGVAMLAYVYLLAAPIEPPAAK